MPRWWSQAANGLKQMPQSLLAAIRAGPVVLEWMRGIMRAKIMLTLSVGINAVLLSALTHVYYQVPDWDFVSVDGIFAVNSGHSEQMSKRPPDGVAPRLGEVIELLLPTQQDGESRELFDFETRRHMSEPKFYHCDSRMQIGWIRTNGLDISGVVTRCRMRSSISSTCTSRPSSMPTEATSRPM